MRRLKSLKIGNWTRCCSRVRDQEFIAVYGKPSVKGIYIDLLAPPGAETWPNANRGGLQIFDSTGNRWGVL